MQKCKHKWVDMEDGSLDRICVRCRKFAMQAVAIMKPPKLNEQDLLVGNVSKGLSDGLSKTINSLISERRF